MKFEDVSYKLIYNGRLGREEIDLCNINHVAFLLSMSAGGPVKCVYTSISKTFNSHVFSSFVDHQYMNPFDVDALLSITHLQFQNLANITYRYNYDNKNISKAEHSSLVATYSKLHGLDESGLKSLCEVLLERTVCYADKAICTIV